MTKYGFWNVNFELTLEGEEVRWEDLDGVSQEHIVKMILEGYCSGEICIEEDEPICKGCGHSVEGSKFEVSPDYFYCPECFINYLKEGGYANMLDEYLSLEDIADNLGIEVIE